MNKEVTIPEGDSIVVNAGSGESIILTNNDGKFGMQENLVDLKMVLTPEEASILYEVTRCIGGHPQNGKPRHANNKLQEALVAAGAKADLAIRNYMIEGSIYVDLRQ